MCSKLPVSPDCPFFIAHLVFSSVYFMALATITWIRYIIKLERVQRRAARYVQNNYHNTSSVTSMIDTLGWPTLAERRLKTRLIMLYKITHALIAIPNNILIPTDSRTRKSHNQTFRHITTQKDTYKCSFFPHTI